MIRKLILLFLPIATGFVKAQNVGIGTIAPQTKLHIVSPTDEVLRLDANYPFVSLYTGGVYKGYLWKSSNSIEVGSATGSNLAITLAPNGFQRFYVGVNGNVGIGTINPIQQLQVEGATYLNGNVGISNSNPLFPLSFNGSTGDKISLWNDGTSTHYGFGIQSSLFQVFSKTNIDDIAFGYGSSNSFTERMRIKGNGNVGIGAADPNFLLDVNNRIRIRSGGDFSNTAGIWLNKTDNSALQSFIGIENDNYVGFYGLTAGWKFSVNTQTGALKINGSEGQAGQVLQSNGGAAASWASPTNTLYNNTTIVYGTSSAAQGRIYFADKSYPLTIAKLLNWFEDRLPGGVFWRTHKTHLINSRYVRQLPTSQKHFLILNTGETLAVSRRRMALFRYTFEMKEPLLPGPPAPNFCSIVSCSAIR